MFSMLNVSCHLFVQFMFVKRGMQIVVFVLELMICKQEFSVLVERDFSLIVFSPLEPELPVSAHCTLQKTGDLHGCSLICTFLASD